MASKKSTHIADNWQPPDRVVPYEATPADEGAEWAAHGARQAKRLFWVAALCPLVMTSFLFDEMYFVWPWTLAGFGSSDGAPFAPAGGDFGALVWIPLFAAIVTACITRFAPARRVPIACAVFGALLLALSSVLRFGPDAMLIGAPFLAALADFGPYLLAATVAAICVAGGNRLRKQFNRALTPRMLTGAGGLAIALMVCALPIEGEVIIAVLASGEGWGGGAWPGSLFVVLLLAFGAAGLANTIRHGRAEECCTLTSVLARALFVALPVVWLLLRATSSDPTLENILDGGAVPALMAMVKCLALFYGTLLLCASGLAGFLAGWLWNRIGGEADPAPNTSTMAASTSRIARPVSTTKR